MSKYFRKMFAISFLFLWGAVIFNNGEIVCLVLPLTQVEIYFPSFIFLLIWPLSKIFLWALRSIWH